MGSAPTACCLRTVYVLSPGFPAVAADRPITGQPSARVCSGDRSMASRGSVASPTVAPSSAERRRPPERSPPAPAGGLGDSALRALPGALADLVAEFPPRAVADLSANRLEELEDALRTLTEMTCAAKDAKRAAAGAAHNVQQCRLIGDLLSQDDVREVLLAAVPFPTLCSRLGRTCKLLNRWVVDCALTRGITAADVAASEHVAVLRHLCTVAGATIKLEPGRYQLGDARNADHLQSGTYADFETSTQSSWNPKWRAGFGPLAITGNNITLVGPPPCRPIADLAAPARPAAARTEHRRTVGLMQLWLPLCDRRGRGGAVLPRKRSRPS